MLRAASCDNRSSEGLLPDPFPPAGIPWIDRRSSTRPEGASTENKTLKMFEKYSDHRAFAMAGTGIPPFPAASARI
jgi:hypothetical protein